MKVAIIQAIDRKVALDDIALSKGIEFGELLDEVEAIVYSSFFRLTIFAYTCVMRTSVCPSSLLVV